MIIKSNRRHGEGRVGLFVPHGQIVDDHGILHDQPFVIMEIVTKQDYLNECIAENKPVGMILSDDNFYRVSID